MTALYIAAAAAAAPDDDKKERMEGFSIRFCRD